jgi:hypothetical protein
MRSLYARPHRGSIYEPATIHDIPQEVLEKSLILLLPSTNDLVAASLACRAWRPVAQKLIHSRVKIDYRRVESQISGYRLNSLVFGSSSFQISALFLELFAIGKDYIPMIAQIVAPTLSSLRLVFNGDDDVSVCYETLEIVFSQCRWIRNLRLVAGWFGNDVDAITPTIKEGFIRLNQFELIGWYGNVRWFMESTPIPNLKSFRFTSYANAPVEDINIVDAAVTNYGRTLINLNLSECYVSSANLVKIAEICRVIEKLSLSFILNIFSLSDMKIIASLPRLKSLKIGEYCRFADGSMIALARCRGLNHLSVYLQDGLIDVLRVIGGNLVSLELWDMNLEVIDSVVEYCPNLQYLEMRIVGRMLAVRVDEAGQKLKNGLKRLAKLEVNGAYVRLGTDWVG